MRTGSNGQIAISWAQTEIDGLEAAPLDYLIVGRAWCWRGRGIQLASEADRVAHSTGSSSVAAVLAVKADIANRDDLINECARIEFSNGAQTFVAELVRVLGEASLMLVFKDGCPEPNQDFWISAAAPQIEPIEIDHTDGNKVVAFPATQIGSRSVPADLPRIASLAAE